jgi:hypothetical protein
MGFGGLEVRVVIHLPIGTALAIFIPLARCFKVSSVIQYISSLRSSTLIILHFLLLTPCPRQNKICHSSYRDYLLYTTFSRIYLPLYFFSTPTTHSGTRLSVVFITPTHPRRPPILAVTDHHGFLCDLNRDLYHGYRLNRCGTVVVPDGLNR